MSNRFWTLAGYEAGEKVFEQSIPVSAIAESELKGLLQRLAARGLSEEEVIHASLGSDHRSDGLVVAEVDGEGFGFTTAQGAGRYYVATLGETE